MEKKQEKASWVNQWDCMWLTISDGEVTSSGDKSQVSDNRERCVCQRFSGGKRISLDIQLLKLHLPHIYRLNQSYSADANQFIYPGK